jgi:hypothetical protein
MRGVKGRASIVVVLAAALLAGCSEKGSSKKDDEPKGFPAPEGGQGGIIRTRNLQLVQNDFKQLGLAYHNFYDARKRGPANVDELAPFFDNDARLKQALQQGQYVFHWNMGLNQMPQGTSNTILAYERDPDAAGNRVVVMGDATPKIMGKADFEAALKAQGK